MAFLRQIKAIVFLYDVSGSCAVEFHDLGIQEFTLGANTVRKPFLTHCYNRPQGESYCNDGLVKDCQAVEERASSGAATVIWIECGAGRICRSLQQPRTGEEENASSLERQGPGRNPQGAKSPMGEGPGREEVGSAAVPAAVAAGATLQPIRGAATGRPLGASLQTSLLDWRGAPPDHQR